MEIGKNSGGNSLEQDLFQNFLPKFKKNPLNGKHPTSTVTFCSSWYVSCTFSDAIDMLKDDAY